MLVLNHSFVLQRAPRTLQIRARSNTGLCSGDQQWLSSGERKCSFKGKKKSHCGNAKTFGFLTLGQGHTIDAFYAAWMINNCSEKCRLCPLASLFLAITLCTFCIVKKKATFVNVLLSPGWETNRLAFFSLSSLSGKAVAGLTMLVDLWEMNNGVSDNSSAWTQKGITWQMEERDWDFSSSWVLYWTG